MISRSKKSLHAAEQERADVRIARANWKQEQPRLDPKKLIFIDETGTSTNMTRLRGRAARGQRLPRQGPARPLEDDDVCRRPASGRHHRSVRHRCTDEWR